MRVIHKRPVSVLGLLLALIAGLLLGFAGDATAGSNKLDGFGQYLVVKASGGGGDNSDFAAANPTSTSMYGCLIHYSSSGNFQSCTCDVVGPMARFSSNSPFGSGHVEWICAPNLGKSAGKVGKSFGMMARAPRGVEARALNAKLFKLHPDSGQRSSMISSCCSEMASDGISKEFFKAFDRFECP